MYSQSFASSSSSTNSNYTVPIDPMFHYQGFDMGYGTPSPGMPMDYNNMMTNQQFRSDSMGPPNDGMMFYGHQQFPPMAEQFPMMDFQMMPEQAMDSGFQQNFQLGFQQDRFQPLPHQIPMAQSDIIHRQDSSLNSSPDVDFNEVNGNFVNGMNGFPAPPVNDYNFSTTSPPPPKRKFTKKKVPKVSTMHLNTSCSNCGTRETKLWRRNEQGEPECNSCNLYERTKGVKRPATLWNKPTIKRRRRPVVAPVTQE
ncbi:Protein CBR-END-3 [Caenorhabditis briggsae]|uniref:Protein CBR-END-3 n=2 Tax=Caenorhabditis briggsae TaxID=6238 RepID=A8XD37_CAEBR|nr:Protein CBR-END-3 [Caenorhabditis briggsae]ULT85940.1 hypothetical protein L3Y34_005963 [Caenorhabditis briggsae]CAP30556.1 Protein CBR-END-3 [Caenorhabditis briggsae]